MALVEPDVEEERAVFVDGDELRGIFRCGVQIGGDGFGAAVEDGELVKAIGGGRGCAVGVAIGEMPFAEMCGAVASLLEKARDGGGAGIEPIGHVAGLVLHGAGKVLINAEARRKHPSQRSDAAGRADGIEDVELVKIGALACEPVEVRGLQPRMAVRGEITPAPVVGEDEDDEEDEDEDDEDEEEEEEEEEEEAPKKKSGGKLSMDEIRAKLKGRQK